MLYDQQFREMASAKGVAIDTETNSVSGKKKDSLHFRRCGIRCVGFAYKVGGEIKSFAATPDDIDLLALRALITTQKLIGHNVKFDLKVLYNNDPVEATNIYADTYIMARLLDENQDCDLDSLARNYLGDSKQGSYEEEDIEKLKAYCAKDAELTYRLAEKFYPMLEKQCLLDLFKIEMKVVDRFYRAEIKGVDVDVEYLRRLSAKYTRHTERIKRVIYRTTGEINLNSNKQLCEVLYGKLSLPVLRQTKKESASTDTRTLELLGRRGHKIAKWILLYRHWEMLVRHIDKLVGENIDGKIYPTFKTYGTETGRFSCADPNLQQIPSKTPESKAIRKSFKGELIIGDYSNVELRLLAHFTRDPKLLAVYRVGGSGDLHQSTAELLHVDRQVAKTINFGISYGMGYKKLAEALNIDEVTAEDYIKAWYKTYSMVQPWKDMIVNTCKKYGYVKSLMGRKRRLSFTGMNKYQIFSQEREVINFVIQGSSADITKKAIAELHGEDIRLQVHDELVIYKGKRTVEEIKFIMENVTKLLVPLTVEIGECNSWDEK